LSVPYLVPRTLLLTVSEAPDDGRPTTNDASPTADDSPNSADPADEEGTASDLPDDVEALTDEVEALREEVDGLKAEREELNERLLRKAAELENVRRRMDREKKRRHVAGKETVLESMLEVLDDFERSLDAAQDLDVSEDPESAYETLKGGVEMVYRKFQDQLQSLGVEPIEAEGQPFDEQLHEAMMRQPSDDVEPGNVLQEVQKGYTMGDRVLRHSRVVVAAEPSESGSAADSA
jgi:molecular chaperone GrpE